MVLFCVFKQKTAYEMRISDWSSDVCSSDLPDRGGGQCGYAPTPTAIPKQHRPPERRSGLRRHPKRSVNWPAFPTFPRLTPFITPPCCCQHGARQMTVCSGNMIMFRSTHTFALAIGPDANRSIGLARAI